jgi:hypothetical protein
LTVATQLSYDFAVNLLEVLGAMGVPRRLRPFAMRRLALIYDIARKNWQKINK